MKVLVTGANGFIGSWVVDRLQQEGHEVTILVRKTSDLSELKNFQGQKVYGDITDLASLQEAFKGQQAVFHLAGLIAYKPQDRPALDRINVFGTQNVCQAVEDCHVESLVHFSSVVAIGAGKSPQEVLNEDSPYNLSHLNLGYFETKRQAEGLVLALAKKNKAKVTIVNPSTAYGPGDARKGSRGLQLRAAKGKLPFYTHGGVSVVSIHDVVEGVICAWEKGKHGQRYILANENWTMKQLLDQICFYAQSNKAFIPIPNWLIHGAALAGDLSAQLGLPLGITTDTFEKLTRYHWFDNTKAIKELGLKFTPATVAIEESVRWMFDHKLIEKHS